MVETPFTLKLSIKKSLVKIYQENVHTTPNLIFNVPPPQSQHSSPTDSKYREDFNLQKSEVEKLKAKNRDLESDLNCASEKNLSLSTD